MAALPGISSDAILSLFDRSIEVRQELQCVTTYVLNAASPDRPLGRSAGATLADAANQPDRRASSAPRSVFIYPVTLHWLTATGRFGVSGHRLKNIRKFPIF